MRYVFHKKYRELTQAEQDLMDDVKDVAQDLHDIFDEFQSSLPERDERMRCIKLAKTKLEEAVMWAIKGVTT